ncbi:MAG TPA: galactokinase family protein, partial [Solirubrobacteraceae bacterium]|nr:galactokinase family protein [Solirubrobacteraceae bacterium]
MGRARVNLIGEHTDYNDGLVLPVALPLRTRVEVVRREGAMPESPYAAAVGRVLGVRGFDVSISSDVPIGAGLGSSSALTVAVARALSDAFDLGLSDRDAALAAHRAESVEMGVGSGVMDQFAAALGREGEALLIDCRSLEVRRVPLPAEAELLVIDSGIRHSNLAPEGVPRGDTPSEGVPRGDTPSYASSYGARVAECRRAAELLGVRSLRDLVPVAGSGAAIQALPPPLDRR